MKDLQKAIEEIVRETMQEVESLMKSTPPNFAYNEVMNTIYKQRSTKLTQLITSREQEIGEEAVRGFVEFNKGRLRTQSFNVEQLKQLYFDDVESALEYLAQQKENK